MNTGHKNCCACAFHQPNFQTPTLLEIFWMLHLHTTTNLDQSQRTRTQTVIISFNCPDGDFIEHSVLGQNLSVNKSAVGFKGKTSFTKPKEIYEMEIPHVYILVDSGSSYVYTLVPLSQKEHYQKDNKTETTMYVTVM
jgi:hypothetical protein